MKIRKDLTKYVNKREECKKFGNISHPPVEELHNMVAPWSFATWGIEYLDLSFKQKDK